MNKLLLVVLLLGALSSSALAQRPLVPAPGLPADSLTGRIKFQGVVPVPGAPAAELQARAREWVALTFQDVRQVTQLDDAARGVLILRGYTTTWVDTKVKRPLDTTPLAFTCRLDFRDGRYRYQVFDLGGPVGLSSPSDPSLNSAPGVASRQAYEVAAWLLGGTATVAASSRQYLYQPELDAYPKDNNIAANFDKRWPEVSGVFYQTITRLVESLRRHETAAPSKW
jgi:hypothetical protein